MTDVEREKLALGEKLKKCPICESTQEDGHEECFHCSDCGYLQCCDYDGTYTNDKTEEQP